MLKKILIFLAILIIPINIFAQVIEIPPYLKIEGIDQDKYDISKTITSKEIIIDIKEKTSDYYYSWSFKRDKIKTDLVLNFNVNFDSPNENIINNLSKNVEKTYLSFEHHGDLPSKAHMKIYVGDKYKDKEKLYLYYYNDTSNTIEFIDNNIKVKNGFIEFNINHCSDYFLTTTIVNDAINNPGSVNFIIIGLVALVLVLVGTTIFSTKK